MPINYDLAKKEGPKLKAALTRAKHAHDPESVYVATKKACQQAVARWEVWGAWPDNWSLWQRSLDDAFFAWQRWARENSTRTLVAVDWSSRAPRLEELNA